MNSILHYLSRLLPDEAKTKIRTLLFRFQERGFQPYYKDMQAGDVNFKFWIGDSTGHKWYEGNWYSLEVKYLRDRLIAPGDSVMECGAHHGCMTVLFSRWVGEKGKVIAFESFPRNADIAQKNIDINFCSNVILVSKAVGAESRVVSIAEDSNSHVLLARTQGIEVEMVPLDLYRHHYPTMLKIDVEGFEVEVLKGATNILTTTPKLDIEIHTEALKKYHTTVDELFSLLNRECYDFFIQWEDWEQPRPYRFDQEITKRVHLFGFPKNR